MDLNSLIPTVPVLSGAGAKTQATEFAKNSAKFARDAGSQASQAASDATETAKLAATALQKRLSDVQEIPDDDDVVEEQEVVGRGG